MEKPLKHQEQIPVGGLKSSLIVPLMMNYEFLVLNPQTESVKYASFESVLRQTSEILRVLKRVSVRLAELYLGGFAVFIMLIQ